MLLGHCCMYFCLYLYLWNIIIIKKTKKNKHNKYWNIDIISNQLATWNCTLTSYTKKISKLLGKIGRLHCMSKWKHPAILIVVQLTIRGINILLGSLSGVWQCTYLPIYLTICPPIYLSTYLLSQYKLHATAQGCT